MDGRLQPRRRQQHVRIGVCQLLESVAILCVNARQTPAAVGLLSAADGLDGVVAISIRQWIRREQPAVFRLEQFIFEMLSDGAFHTEFVHLRRKRMEDNGFSGSRERVQTRHGLVGNDGNRAENQHLVFIQIQFRHLLRVHEDERDARQIQHAPKPVVHVHVIPHAFSNGALVVLAVLRDDDGDFRHDMRPLEQRRKPLRESGYARDGRHALRRAARQIQNAVDAFLSAALAGIPHVPLEGARFPRPSQQCFRI